MMKQLIDRFMAGETTGEEEKFLFEAFAPGRDIDPSLEGYRPMMQWYAALSGQTASAAPAARPRRFVSWIWAAASLAVLITVAFMVTSRVSYNRELYAEYRGSYIIKNGVKSSDISEILPELQRVEMLAEQKRLETERLIQAHIGQADPVEEAVSGHTPEVERIIRSALEN